MVVDKKFERIMGINLERREENKPNQAQEYFMNELLPKTDFYIKQYAGKYKRLCNIITNPDNYISDCNIAIFMLMGERYASVKGLLDVPRNWPFSVKDTKTTAWCGAFQSVILLGDNQDLCFTDLCDKGRLGRFEYHRMADIYQRLEEQIENEYESEEKMQTGDQIDINECLKRVYRDSTAGRKENWVLADIFLGRSLSIILYHWISQISKRKEVKLSWFKEMIDLFSAMKCFQLRNVLMDIIFRITFAEILKMDGGKNGDESLKELIQRLRIEWEPLLITVNQYYSSAALR